MVMRGAPFARVERHRGGRVSLWQQGRRYFRCPAPAQHPPRTLSSCGTRDRRVHRWCSDVLCGWSPVVCGPSAHSAGIRACRRIPGTNATTVEMSACPMPIRGTRCLSRPERPHPTTSATPNSWEWHWNEWQPGDEAGSRVPFSAACPSQFRCPCSVTVEPLSVLDLACSKRLRRHVVVDGIRLRYSERAPLIRQA